MQKLPDIWYVAKSYNNKSAGQVQLVCVAYLQPFNFPHIGYVKIFIIDNNPMVMPESFFTANDYEC